MSGYYGSYPPSQNATATTGSFYGPTNPYPNNSRASGGSNAKYSPIGTAESWQPQSSSFPQQQQQQQQQPTTTTTNPQYNQWNPHHHQQEEPSYGTSIPTTTFFPQQPSQQQQQQAPQPQRWDPALAAVMAFSGNQQMAGQMVTQMGQTFLQESWSKMIPGLESFVVTLRAYFAVDHRYVLQKIKTLLFPFLKQDWQRTIKGYGGPDGSVPMHDLPIADDNAPDLYLPFMSLITYVLLCAVVYGNAGKFNPDVLPAVTTKCFFTVVLEVLLIRLGIYFYITQHQQQQQYNQPIRVNAFLDLLAYTGYKYLGLSVNMLFGLIGKHFKLGYRVYYITFLWTASAASYFMLQTMNHTILPNVYHGKASTRQFLILGFAALQFATMWFVSQTKNL